MSEIIVECRIMEGKWTKNGLFEGTKKCLAEAAKNVQPKLPNNAEVSVAFRDDKAVQKLNKKWRGIDKPTNVLSFATNDGIKPNEWSPLLGDIVLAHETIKKEAKQTKRNVNHHVYHLVIHGFLHLTGYDHETEKNAKKMEGMEVRILKELGIPDPYMIWNN